MPRYTTLSFIEEEFGPDNSRWRQTGYFRRSPRMSRVASHVAVGKSLSTIAFTVISLGHLVAFVIIRNVVEVTFVVVLVFGDEQEGSRSPALGLGIPTKPQCFCLPRRWHRRYPYNRWYLLYSSSGVCGYHPTEWHHLLNPCMPGRCCSLRGYIALRLFKHGEFPMTCCNSTPSVLIMAT